MLEALGSFLASRFRLLWRTRMKGFAREGQSLRKGRRDTGGPSQACETVLPAVRRTGAGTRTRVTAGAYWLAGGRRVRLSGPRLQQRLKGSWPATVLAVPWLTKRASTASPASSSMRLQKRPRTTRISCLRRSRAPTCVPHLFLCPCCP